VKLLVWLVLGYVVYRIFKGFASGKDEQVSVEPGGKEVHCDPVCGVYVSGDDAVIGNLEGEKLYFCSRECLEKFRDQLEIKANK
jgi:YHS domain-containing protein